MPKVSVIVLIYNSRKYITLLFDAIFGQTYGNLEVIAVINGSDDGSREMIVENYSQAKILDPGKNLWFSKGNNLAIRESTGEFIQLINHDLILEPGYIENIIKAFDDPKVAAATGKLLQYDFQNNRKTNLLDSTGITMSVSGRGRDRGQNQVDQGQYDDHRDVFGVSGAGPMYRRSALENVKFEQEYFDEDFIAYWEDVDLSWRLSKQGWKNVYVPEAIGYHGRTAGSAKGGYLHLWHFIQHHKKLPALFRQHNYRNHIWMYIKNAKFIFHPAFILREILMLGYILLFEISTSKVIPELISKIPRMLKKRKA
jgi:GT2 family glycosyltransferase